MNKDKNKSNIILRTIGYICMPIAMIIFCAIVCWNHNTDLMKLRNPLYDLTTPREKIIAVIFLVVFLAWEVYMGKKEIKKGE